MSTLATITLMRNLADFQTTVLPGKNATDFDTKLPVAPTDAGSLCKKNDTTIISHWSNDPLFYIITVLMFYAFSIIILMVKYIRRERQEAEFDNFYYEFVSREKFQTPQFKNAQNMCNMLRSVEYSKICDTEDPLMENTAGDSEMNEHKHSSETLV